MGWLRDRSTRKRLTGVGATALGFGGNAQWETVESDTKVAQDVITFLEDRRVLYLPVDIEIVEASMASVRELREYLTTALHRTSPNSPLARNLRLIRGACRDFMTRIDGLGHRHGEWGWSRFDNPEGVMALGIWRGQVLANLAEIVDLYSLSVDGPLAGALPSAE